MVKKLQQQQQKLLDRFDIVLDNPEEVYFAGQEIAGKVLIECAHSRQLNAILFEVKGRARTHWTKSRKTCSANEAYFCEQFNTEYTRKLPKAATDAEMEEEREEGARKDSTKLLGHILPAGLHEIPFSYTLPKHLPTSFEGSFGFIRYTCRAICERPWDFDIACLRAFTVIGIEDLNQESELLSLPLETRSSHPISAYCMQMGTISTEMRLAKGGVTPGECVKVHAKVRNDSRRTLRGLELRLCQNVVYKSKTFAGAEQQRSTRHIVQRVPNAEPVRRGAQFEWKKALPVPAVAPRLKPKCRLIDCTYCVELNCRSPPFCVSLPLVIGTIPLLPFKLLAATTSEGNGTALAEMRKKTEEETEAEDRMDEETERQCAAKKRVRMPSSVLSELYPTLPSPYFRELYSGPVKMADDRERKFQFGPNSFVPKYPFYE